MKETLWVIRHLRKHTLQTVYSLALSTAAGVVASIDPLLMRHLIDRSLPSRRISESLLCIGVIAACYIGRAALSGVGTLLGFRVAQRLGQQLRQDLLERMSELPAEWHSRTMLGEKITRFDSDVEQIAQFSADSAGVLVRIAVFFCLNLVIMIGLNADMTATILPLLPLFYFVRTSSRATIQNRAADTQDRTGKAIGRISEHLGAVLQLQLLGSEKGRTSDSLRCWIEVVQAQWRQRRSETIFSVAISTVLGLSILVVLCAGAFKYIEGTITIGTLVAFYAYTTRIFEPISTAMDLYARSERMLASSRRVLEIINQASSVSDVGHISAPATNLQKGITFAGVSFRYLPEREVIRDVHLEIKAGKCIAIVGASGSGKSTLAQLLVRVADPNTGAIFVDDYAASDYSLTALRKTICYIPQAPTLFCGTIRENLLYGNPFATARQLEEVVGVTQLVPMLHTLVRGLDYSLQAGASDLSGGELQRLAIARALLREPAVLVLDEATSALDAPTEAAVLRSVRNFRPGKTLILISHRVKSLDWVDCMIAMKQGAIVARGDPTTLYRTSRYYRSLVDA